MRALFEAEVVKMEKDILRRETFCESLPSFLRERFIDTERINDIVHETNMLLGSKNESGISTYLAFTLDKQRYIFFQRCDLDPETPSSPLDEKLGFNKVKNF